ncbi:MAG: hypothetical protein EP335_01570 [Alphaproteobacteria bacterium]|nr:MAG: hypothetical protein EP335_01570 [Alphaproteobacteria bacterium]
MAVGKPTLLITSAAYADDTICVELGRLPPSFLPLGNKRLYVHQVEAVRHLFDRIVISLPESFRVPEKDSKILAELDVDVEYVPDGLSLGNSIAFCLKMIGDHTVAILHGDTLIYDIMLDKADGFTSHVSDQPYQWAVLSDDTNDISLPIISEHIGDARHKVLSGFFLFSDATKMIRALTITNGNFIESLRLYNKALPLFPLSAGEWFDFGHFHTYYHSKTKLTTQRVFNGLDIDRIAVTKTSKDSFKMACEANWLRAIPDELKLFTPTYLGDASGADGATGYRTERLMFSSLNDMFIFGRLNRHVWDAIFDECAFFLESCNRYRPAEFKAEDCAALYLPKTLERLHEFGAASGFPVEESLRFNGTEMPSPIALAEFASQFIPALKAEDARIMHGDFCFSNILYDSRARQIRVVDPRGFINRGEPTIYGDSRYDVAKLFHSAVGYYDLIIAGYFDVSYKDGALDFSLIADDYVNLVHDSFVARQFGPVRGDDPSLIAIAIHLFLSMVPLHSDHAQRQLAFIANAYRLFGMLQAKVGGAA